MKKLKQEKLGNKIKLTKKVQTKSNNSTLLNSSSTYISSTQNHLIKNKNNKLSHNQNIHNQSSIIKNYSTVENNDNKNKGNFTITSYMNKNPIKIIITI